MNRSMNRHIVGTSSRSWIVAMLGIMAGTGIVSAEESKPAHKPWLSSLAKGREEAVRLRRPIFVKVGAEWCPWCKKLDQEMARPELGEGLGRWTLVALDADGDAADVGALGVGPIPALRLLTPAGRIVATRDGFLPARELAGWLGENHDKAAELPIDELTEQGEPSAVAVIRLVRQFDQSDAVLREAAILRLHDHPKVAAAAVIDAFAKGTLQSRLAALELFEAWKAPSGALDPWRPSTVTEARLARLHAWAAERGRAEPAANPAIAPEQLAAAGREIDALLKVDAASVPAIRERLARFRRALLPQVYERLKHAESDDSRARLTALRYRLVASDSLVLKWPGGLDRLAATDVATRHRAVDELVQIGSPDEEGLWLELFSDPDPLVRETALRGLDAPGASGALIGLLNDPEPNVRAAVLKQLAEHPAGGLVPKLAEYVAKEGDPDLVVHAVRVLREIGDKKALKVLMSLLGHSSWSVRAEAVEAVGKRFEHGTRGADPETADAVAATVTRLDDADGFVAGRALAALKGVDQVAIVDPLIRIAEKHPDLAPKAIETLMLGSSTKPKALPLLSKFAAHKRADIRAAVVKALGLAESAAIEPAVRAALADSESTVRVAGARALFAKLEHLRSQAGTGPAGPLAEGDEQAVAIDVGNGRPPGGFAGAMFRLLGQGLGRLGRGEKDVKVEEAKPEEPKEDDARPDVVNEAADRYEAWLARFQGGKNKPSWMEPAIAPLRSMLAAPAAEERLAAALPLIALGEVPDALATLLKVVKERRDLVGEASQALPWRHRADRLALFDGFLAVSPDPDEFSPMASALAEVPDQRTLDPLWRLTARDDLPSTAAYGIIQALQKILLGPNAYNPSQLSKATKRQAAAVLRPKVESGPEWQRVIALVLLATVAADEVAEVARRLVNERDLSPELRQNAFQVLLLASDREEARKLALASLSGDEPGNAKIALLFLTSDFSRLHMLREWVYLPYTLPALQSQGTIPKLPKELKAETVRPLLKATDPETAALAGYVLALQGNASGVEPLLAFWRTTDMKDASWSRRVYQAIAHLDDDAKVPILEQIYTAARAQESNTGYNPMEIDIKDFYWTIRSMSGPDVKKLRQRIRRDVGMEVLRGGVAPTPVSVY